MVTTIICQSGNFGIAQKGKSCENKWKIIFHSRVEYPKVQIPRKKNSVFEQISGLPPP